MGTFLGHDALIQLGGTDVDARGEMLGAPLEKVGVAGARGYHMSDACD